VSLNANVPAGYHITATATLYPSSSFYDSTSEFSTHIVATNGSAVPTITTGPNLTVDENETIVSTIAVTDPDSSIHTWSIIGGTDGALFSIDENSGELSFITPRDKEAADDRTFVVDIRVSDGVNYDARSFNITIKDIDEYPLGAIYDANPAANKIAENTIGTANVGVNAFTTDFDATDEVIFSLTNDAGGRFSIDSSTGVVRQTAPLDAEAGTSHTITVQATSTNSGIQTADFIIDIIDTDEFSVTDPSDVDIAVNEVSESSAVGTLTGITAQATDADISDNVLYSLTNNAGGRFSIDASTGVVTVAGALDAETANSHLIAVRATSDDSSFKETNFVVTILDADEFPLSNVVDINAAVNSVDEHSIVGTLVGVTAFATDADSTDQISYSLIDDASGLFTIDAITGVVSVAGTIDAEVSSSHTITAQAISTRSGSTTAIIAIQINDIDEFNITTPVDTDATVNEILENATIGSATGVTAFAFDNDVTDGVSYSLTNDANGRFTIDAATGVVTLVSALDAETASSHTVTIRASSDDLSFNEADFVIKVIDADEFPLSTVTDLDPTTNSVDENSAIGTRTGIIAFATDPDLDDDVSYSLTNDANGRFAIDASTGIVTVSAVLDAETTSSHTITVQAISTRSGTTSADFLISVNDLSEFAVSPVVDSYVNANEILENASIGSATGITASAFDSDATDGVSYSLTNDANGRFTIDAATGVVTLVSALDAETASSHTVTIRASSDDSSFNEGDFVISVLDVDEFPLTSVTDLDPTTNTVDENSAIGTLTGISAFASDPDVTDGVSYSLTNDANGRFTIDASTGIVTVSATLDAETAASHTITVQASSTRSGTTSADFVISVNDLNEVNISPVIDSDVNANEVLENALIGSPVGIRAQALDTDISDGITYSLTDDAGGRFAINATTGEITIAATLDAETALSHNIRVRATSDDSSFTDAQFTVVVIDENEYAISTIADTDVAANEVIENVAIGSVVGLTAQANDTDVSDNVMYSLSDNAGGRFSIDAVSGVVTVAAPLNATAANSHNITVRANSDDGSFHETDFAITVLNADANPLSAVTDFDHSANSVNENSATGTLLGITAFATDPDLEDNVSYSLSNDAGGRFAIDALSGVVTVAAALDAENAAAHIITVQASSTRSGTNSADFVISVNDVDEFNVTMPTDTNTLANEVTENAQIGDTVGIVAEAVDADANDTVSYTLTDNAAGHFAIDASTGVVTVASTLDADVQNTHVIEVNARSSDGSSAQTSFDIAIGDINDESPSINENQSFTVLENLSGPLLIGAIGAADADSTGSLQEWRIDSGNEHGLFELDPASGILNLTNGQSLNFEIESEYLLNVSVSDGVNRSDQQRVRIIVVDQNDTPEANSDHLSINEDNTLSIAIATLLGNDSDADGDSLSVLGVSAAIQGTVLETGNNEIIYTPAPEFSGSDQFEYTISDNAGGISTGHVFINVIATNDRPNLIVASTILVDENQTTVNASIQASDADGDQLVFSLSGEDAGLFAINETSGQIHFLTAPDFEQPRDGNGDNHYLLQVTATDPAGLSDYRSLLVDVQNANDIQTVSADNISINEFNSGVLGIIEVSDQDTVDTHSFEIIGGNTFDAIQIANNGEIEQVNKLPPGIYYLDVIVRDQTGSEVQMRLEIQVVSESELELGAANLQEISNVNSDIYANSGHAGTTNSTEGSNGSIKVGNYASDSSATHANTDSHLTSIVTTSDEHNQEKADVAQDVQSILREAFSQANMIAGESFTADNPSSHSNNRATDGSVNPGRQLILDRLATQSRAVNGTLEALISSFESQFAEFDLSPQLMQALQGLKDNTDSNVDEARKTKELIVTSATIVSGTLTVGIITWLLNSGSLVATALTTSPLWRAIDPIPVLANRTQRERSLDV